MTDLTEREVTVEAVRAMQLCGAELWRNNKGGQRIKYGLLAKGSSDWIGIMPIVVTSSMVGKKIGCFVALEVKREKGGKVDPEQIEFIRTIRSNGGIAGVARCFLDARALIQDKFSELYDNEVLV